MPNCIECSDSRTWFSWTNNFTELQQETTKASGIHTFQYVKTMIRCFFIEMHGRSLERCKEAASKECYILVMSIHKALVFCYFSFSQVLSCYMVYGPIALASYLMVFTCCLTVQLLWSDSVQLSWPGGRLPEHFLMGLFKLLNCHLFLILKPCHFSVWSLTGSITIPTFCVCGWNV